MTRLEQECPTAAHWTEQQYLQSFRAGEGGPERLVLVADATSFEKSRNLDTGVCGFLVARHLAPEWELENIVVAPTSRRMGLGKRLLEALLTRARETNSEVVFLEVRESNAAARTLYAAAGFDQTGCRKSYYTNPEEDAILYRRSLL